jgi:hypothetical protein
MAITSQPLNGEPRPVRIRELVANDIRGTPAGTWVTRDAVVLNLAILCVAMPALAVIELVLNGLLAFCATTVRKTPARGGPLPKAPVLARFRPPLLPLP